VSCEPPRRTSDAAPEADQEAEGTEEVIWYALTFIAGGITAIAVLIVYVVKC
jgi:hypothetical protein